jgi:hypothetical protein
MRKLASLIKNQKDPVILWSFVEYDWNAYEEGRIACLSDHRGNPYKKKTNSWYNWNKGWNSVM